MTNESYVASPREQREADLCVALGNCPIVVLCDETHEEAVFGRCPIHGGDACLFLYVRFKEAAHLLLEEAK